MDAFSMAGGAQRGFIALGYLLLLIIAAALGAYGSVAFTHSWVGLGCLVLAFGIGTYIEARPDIISEGLPAYVVAGSCGVALVLSAFTVIPGCMAMLCGIVTGCGIIAWELREIC